MIISDRGLGNNQARILEPFPGFETRKPSQAKKIQKQRIKKIIRESLDTNFGPVQVMNDKIINAMLQYKNFIQRVSGSDGNVPVVDITLVIQLT